MNLLDQLHELRGRMRRLLWLAGLSWSGACLLCGLFLLGVGDWLWHFDDRGVRVGLLVVLLIVVSGIVWRCLIGPLRRSPTNVELSGQLERRFPNLHSRLATAVEFLEHDVSPKVGSPELQRRLIEQTTADVRSLDFGEVIDRREAQRAALTLALLCGFVLLLVATNSSSASTALRRLLLSDQRWPKSVELQLVGSDLTPVRRSDIDPLKSLQGEPLDLFVINARGALPQPVLVEFLQHGRSPQTEPLRTVTLRDSSDQSREVAAIRLPIDAGVISFRAVGGDDHDMKWHRLWITPPPKLESFRIQVVPPSYTGEPTSTLPEGATQVRAVLGSRLQITGRTTRAIDAASWEAEPVSVSASGRDLGFDLTVTHVGSTTHRLSLTDRDHFENTAALRLEVIGVADPPPVVSLDEPATNQLVTANATVRVQATARDDRKLREIGLEYAVGQVSNLPVEDWQVENLSHENGTREAFVRLDWSLNRLRPMVGDQIALRVVASDHCNVGEPRVGRSVTRTLTVVTPETKQAEIAQRLDLLLHDLESLAARQSQTKDQTDELRVQTEKTGELRPHDRDSLKRVELDQRQIYSRLIDTRSASRGDDVTARAKDLLAQLESNQLNDSATRERLTRIVIAIEGLSRETLPALESTLGKVVKEALIKEPLPDAARSFQEVVSQQGEVLATLTELVSDLTQWRDRRELAREIAELAETQATLNRDTNELAPQTLGKPASQLPSQQQADVAKLADRQARQAERIEQLRQRLAQSSGDKREGEAPAEPERDARMREVVAELDEHALAAKAREAAQDVAANNLGQASRTQQQLADDLKALADKLAASGPASQPSADELADVLRELVARQQTVVEETKRLSSEQQTAGKWTRPLSKAALNLSEAEQELAKGTQELSESLRDIDAVRLTLDLAATDLAAAAGRMRDKQLDDETRRHEQAALSALKSLAEAFAAAVPDPAKVKEDAEQTPANQNAQTPPDEPVPPIAQLKLLRQLQAGVGERTRAAEEGKPKNVPNDKELRKLGDDQQSVSEATSRLFDRIPNDPTDDETVPREESVAAMRQSVEELQQRETGKPTQVAQQTAVESLDALLKLWQQRAARQPSLARSGQPAPMNDKPPGENSSSTGDGNNGQAKGRDSTQARNSSDRDRTGTDAEGELRRQRQLREAVWGHLPPALREKMLNLPHDKTLPKYSEHIRRYYEALAEQE